MTHDMSNDAAGMHEDLPRVDVDLARSMAEQGAVLVDVREADEWAAGHISESVHHPLGDLDERRMPTQGPLVLVCRSGNRSERATRLLLKAGRKDVYNMDGGVTAWREAGFPLTDPDLSAQPDRAHVTDGSA